VNVRCALIHETVIGLYFFEEAIITNSSFLNMLENYALPQFTNNNLIFQLDGVYLFILLMLSVTERAIPRSMDKKSITCSPDLTPSDVFLWGYVKDQMYSQGGQYAGLT
jgi:hypothetical protein